MLQTDSRGGQASKEHSTQFLRADRCEGRACVILQTDVKDTNGAGDTFATAYMLAVAVNDRQPGVTANWAASRAVAQPQVRGSAVIQDSLFKRLLQQKKESWMWPRLSELPETAIDGKL